MEKHPNECKCRGTGLIKCPECKGKGEIVLAVNGETIPCLHCSSFYHEVPCPMQYPQKEKELFRKLHFGRWGGPFVLLMPVAVMAALFALLYFFVKGC
ncbi:MAG: hypothetical protein JNK14_02330 [Chitinophagaceae bacterium]|nr:hypothetical protein [Chitinophagaceae bacterium]